MPTAVVSGRVDARVKERVDAIIREAGTTSADVIKDVWTTIARTGTLPTSQEQIDELEERKRRFAEFKAFIASLPPSKPEYAHMSDDELKWLHMQEKYGV